ncbi:MAG: hypothetical protein VB071_02640 [Lawsonibacter sp.]|nr:hypothetical protein [Lawsonibacter sp.]
MIKLINQPVRLGAAGPEVLKAPGKLKQGKNSTIAYRILNSHNTAQEGG